MLKCHIPCHGLVPSMRKSTISTIDGWMSENDPRKPLTACLVDLSEYSDLQFCELWKDGRLLVDGTINPFRLRRLCRRRRPRDWHGQYLSHWWNRNRAFSLHLQQCCWSVDGRVDDMRGNSVGDVNRVHDVGGILRSSRRIEDLNLSQETKSFFLFIS